MKKFFHTLMVALFLATMSISATSCSDSDDEPEVTHQGTGVTNMSWIDAYNAPKEGETAKLTFTAADAWTAVSNESWCKVQTPRGRDGKSTLELLIAPNSGQGRSAVVTIRVAGTSKSYELTVFQEGVLALNEVNRWIYDYMSENYLWNEPIPTLELTGNAAYDKFLQEILAKIDAKDHLNKDDGHWEDGVRKSYYSYITRSSATSRAFNETETGSGVSFMSATLNPYDSKKVLLLPAIVVPGSSAEKVGIKRGSMISKINDQDITATNYNTMANKLVAGNITVTIAEPTFNSAGQLTSLEEKSPVTLSSTTYEDPAIYGSKVVTLTNGKVVGYLNYMFFDIDYDTQLIEIFKDFKARGVQELIIDLRYNGGGHVLASTVLGSLIAGNAHKGKVYNHTTYNARRTAAGEDGYYKFGEAKTAERTYQPIATAAATSLDLNRIFVLTTVNTASASELVINGLRGVDVTVNIVGTTTNGKNVGMESDIETFGGYKYTLTPITFYSQNAKNFRDYANGFKPDVEFDEDDVLFGDFGTTDDPLFGYAIKWISTGSKPSVAVSRSGRGHNLKRLPISNDMTPVKRYGSIALPKENN